MILIFFIDVGLLTSGSSSRQEQDYDIYLFLSLLELKYSMYCILSRYV